MLLSSFRIRGPVKMRSAPNDFLLFCILLTAMLPTSVAVTLSQFQQINGFSTSCTNAYNTPIPGCKPSDFANNQPCSITCIAGLQSITVLINSACAGTQADPSSLIGHFFQGTGVIALCPNADAATTTSSQATQSQQTTSITLSVKSSAKPASSTSTIVITSSTATIAVSTSAQSSPINPIPTLTSSVESSLSLLTSNTESQPSTGSSASPSSTPVSTTFTLQSSPEGTTVVATPAPFLTSTNSASAAATSKAQQTASNNPDQFGGGGSPFEISIGSRANHMVTASWVSMGLLCWILLNL